MRYTEETRNTDKIPYDNRPIIRQNSNSGHRPEKRSGASKGLALFVCFLVIVNVILCGLVFTLLKRNTKTVEKATINIENTGVLDVSAVVSKCEPSVVRIHAGLPTGVTASTEVDYNMFSRLKSKGSGVIFKDNKSAGVAYIVTCYHVVRGNDSQIYVILKDSYVPIKANLISSTSYSSNFDIAVIKIESNLYTQSVAAPAEIADSSLVIEGDMCLAYGNPQGTGFSATRGIISKAVDLVTVNNVVNRVMRTDAAINAGNSGGGLFEAGGKLIGIVNAKTGDTPSTSSYIDNIAYAIPSDVAIALANNILRNGRPLRADFGIKLGITNENENYQYVDGRKVTKQTVIVAQANANVGFKMYDQILSFTYDGKLVEVKNLYTLDDHIFNFSMGEVVSFKILRAGNTFDIDVTIDSMVAADSQMWYNS